MGTPLFYVIVPTGGLEKSLGGTSHPSDVEHLTPFALAKDASAAGEGFDDAGFYVIVSTRCGNMMVVKELRIFERV